MKLWSTLVSFLSIPLLSRALPVSGGEPGSVVVGRRIGSRAAASMVFYPAPNPNGHGFLITPGGGYGGVALDTEGAQAQKWLNERGYDAWVLRYTTTADAPAPLYPRPQQEALSAVSMIRATGRVQKLGMWGFSAGGHLAAMTLTTPSAGLDFGILAYPVITMDPTYTHPGSRDNLIGTNPSAALVAETSAEKRVTPQTPKTFIFHTRNDPVVPVENALWMNDALAKNGVEHEAYIIPDGPHGLGLALGDPVRNWTPQLEAWMKANGV